MEGRQETLELQEGERIISAKVGSGDCVDRIAFIRSLTQTQGYLGGTGGYETIINKSKRAGVRLAFFKGQECIEDDDDNVTTKEVTTLRRLQLAWVYE